jgi:putative ABC transport system substrate-binding protein
MICNFTNEPRQKCCFVFQALLLACILATLIGCGQHSEGRQYIIGYVDPHPETKEGAPGFLRNMPKHGYIEGKNVVYIKCESNNAQIIENALKDMAARRVDLILTMSPTASIMARKLTQGTKIPVVFITYDAANAGMMKSSIYHDSNITGVQQQGSTPKALEWLSAISPGARHIFVPVSFDTGSAKLSLEKLTQSCKQLGFTLTIAEVKTVEELHISLSSMPKETDAVFMIHSWLVGAHVNEVIDEANKRHIPVVSAGHVDYQNGLVMSYAPTDDSVGAQAARLAHKILEGGAPAYLPVENAEVFLGINLKTAGLAGIRIPESVLHSADFIIR